ncbi:MAG: AMP-binding protein [Pseudomonadota bacterium]
MAETVRAGSSRGLAAERPDIAGATTLAEVLARRASGSDSTWSITFLDSTGNEAARWGVGELETRTRTIAARLETVSAPGDAVLLVFQPGLEFFAAFLACQWSGRLAVPINPPRRNRLLGRLESVVRDCGAKVGLNGPGLIDSVSQWQSTSPVLADIDWHDVDHMDGTLAGAPHDAAPDDIAFIQYTSGSTSQPKGVKVSNRNLMDDMARMADVWSITHDSVMVTWLPAFHDLGLIFGLLQPLYSGCPVVQLAPNSFLQRPGLWLEAITRYRGTHSAAPSFAYDLCCRRIPDDQKAELDLSSLVMTMNAAEPINPEVFERFAETFAPVGFQRDAFAPAYGLAESTLAVTANPTGEPPIMVRLDTAALENHTIKVASDDDPSGRVLAGCGAPLPDVPIAIVDPDTKRRLSLDEVGEIWVGGPTIAQGYWQRDEETAATFGVTIDDETDATGYLRTGDLGAMIDGELVVTGRIKDLIIINGTNHYPQDIERTAQSSHAALRIDNGAAFSLEDDNGAEHVVLVQEVERTQRKADPAPVFEAVAEAVWRELELPVARIVLVDPGAVLRTSSGKIQRLANKQAYLDGKLPVIAEWRATSEATDGGSARAKDTAAQSGDHAALTSWIVTWLAERLDVPVDQIPTDRGFAELGLASIDATEFAFALSDHAGQDLPETLAFDHPTIARVVDHLTGAQSDAKDTTPSRQPPSQQGSDLEELLSAIEQKSP